MGKLLLIFIVFILTFMGKTIIPEIRDNYQLYNTLLKDRKSIFEDIVDISKTKGSNKNFLLSDATLKHSTLSNEILFIAEVKVNNHKYFLFKIMCTVLSKTPFFRFAHELPKTFGVPVKISGTDLRKRRDPPALGAATASVLGTAE